MVWPIQESFHSFDLLLYLLTVLMLMLMIVWNLHPHGDSPLFSLLPSPCLETELRSSRLLPLYLGPVDKPVKEDG